MHPGGPIQDLRVDLMYNNDDGIHQSIEQIQYKGNRLCSYRHVSARKEFQRNNQCLKISPNAHPWTARAIAVNAQSGANTIFIVVSLVCRDPVLAIFIQRIPKF